MIDAQRLNIATTVTIMYDHIETARDRARHLALIRGIQKDTGGFTEFVPLSFIAAKAPMYKKSQVLGIIASVPDEDVRRMYAFSRLMLDPWNADIQASRVKHGAAAGAALPPRWSDRLRRTLMSESISTSAGAPHGQFLHSEGCR